MQYRKFGNTGEKISVLGFGGMRLPMKKADGKEEMDKEACFGLLRHAVERGINYFDTAYFYSGGMNEYVMGEALKPYRKDILLSTKCPMGDVKERGDYRRFLEKQLKKLDTDYIDFYHFHGIGKKNLEEQILPMNLMEEARKAKEEGLIRHISFSFHDEPEVMKEIIEKTEIMESVLCQYNLLDQKNAPVMEYARSKGLGVVVMGPVGGGNLVEPTDVFGREMSTPELALRFVLSNPSVCCALSGMNTMEMLDENIDTAERLEPMTEQQMESIEEILNRVKQLADLYCTGCNYCMPCPQGINIPTIFRLMNLHKVYQLTNVAKQRYSRVGKDEYLGKHPEVCVQCGQCEKKCPQHIQIIRQLEEVRNEFENVLK